MIHASPSDQELEIMVRRCDVATAGPLAVINQGRGRVALCLTSETDEKVLLVAKFYGSDRVANATLAIHAREDIQRLVQEVKRLRFTLAAQKNE